MCKLLPQAEQVFNCKIILTLKVSVSQAQLKTFNFYAQIIKPLLKNDKTAFIWRYLKIYDIMNCPI